MIEINVSEFKAVCLRALEDVRRTGEPLRILKNGKPLAVVQPPPSARRETFGFMKDTLAGPVGDLLSPVTEESEWNVLREARRK